MWTTFRMKRCRDLVPGRQRQDAAPVQQMLSAIAPKKNINPDRGLEAAIATRQRVRAARDSRLLSHRKAVSKTGALA